MTDVPFANVGGSAYADLTESRKNYQTLTEMMDTIMATARSFAARRKLGEGRDDA